jgi:hypothetical protein
MQLNLSQVEHWFAPFLSLLELAPDCRKLKLYSKDSVVIIELGTLKVIDSYNIKDIGSTKYTYEEYKSWIIDTNSVQDLSDKELGLDELHNTIQKYDYQKGVSFRVLEKIVSYIKNIPHDDENEEIISRREAFDIEIKQRLLTKIRASERQYGKLVGSMEPESFEILNSELYDFLKAKKLLRSVILT